MTAAFVEIKRLILSLLSPTLAAVAPLSSSLLANWNPRVFRWLHIWSCIKRSFDFKVFTLDISTTSCPDWICAPTVSIFFCRLSRVTFRRWIRLSLSSEPDCQSFSSWQSVVPACFLFREADLLAVVTISCCRSGSCSDTKSTGLSRLAVTMADVFSGFRVGHVVCWRSRRPNPLSTMSFVAVPSTFPAAMAPSVGSW